MSATSTKTKKKQKPNKKDRVPASAQKVALALVTSGDCTDEQFVEWRHYLSSRRLDWPFPQSLFTPKSPMFWGTDGLAWSSDSRGMVRRVLSQPSDINALAHQWLENKWDVPTIELAYEAIVWAVALPKIADTLRPATWAAMLQRLVELAASHLAASEGDVSDWLGEYPLSEMLLGPELGIWLAYLFPEVPDCVEMASVGYESMSAAIEQLLDGEGLTEARHFPVFRALAACWTRCQIVGRVKGKKSWRPNKAARRDYDWMVRQMLRWTRQDSAPMFGDPDPSFAAMIEQALELTGDEEDRALVDLIFRGKRISDERLPDDASYHGEWAEAALMRPDWDPAGPMVAITYDNESLFVDLANRGERILCGSWDCVIRCENRRLEQESEWDTTCWFSDFDVDFLELEADLEHGWSVQRQYLLARQDLFFWTATIVSGPNDQSGLVEIESTVPMPSGLTVKSDNEHRDVSIAGRRKLAQVLPVGLSEWKQDKAGGELISEAGHLTLSQIQRGAGACMPLFFDLHPERNRRAVTWRQLTVAEDLEIVPGDKAVGYRIQCGHEQWLCYRALKMPGCRTVLGQNYSSEFVFTRFLKDGDTDDLISIE